MKETLILTKILFRNSLNKNISKEKMSFKLIATKLFLFLAIVYIACVIGFFTKEFISLLQEINQTQVFITLALLISLFVGLFQSILSSLNILYFSKDIEYLLPLPISSIQIVFAKLNVMIISGYIAEIITFLIPFSVYGVMTYAEPIFYLIALIIFLILPIVPILLGTIITTILMNFTNILKNKDIVQYLTVFITFVFVIVGQIFIVKTSNMTSFVLTNKLIEIDGLSNMIADRIFILRQAVTALIELESVLSIRNILFLIGEVVTAYILVGFLISKVYIRSAINVSSSQIKKIKTGIKVKIKSTRKSYIGKELKMLFRTPAFFLNTVLPIIILPIIFAIPMLTSNGDMQQQNLDTIVLAITEILNTPMGFAVCLAAINFLYMFNYCSVTSISRDGENAIFMKYIPIELYKQCRYKAMPSFILNLYPLILVIVGLAVIFKGMNIVFLLELLFVALLCNMFTSYCSILIDLLKPKLHWTTEYSVVKQNLNILWDSIFKLILVIIIFAICASFESVHVVTFLISGLLIITTIFYDNLIKQNSINIFKKIC